MFGPADFQKQTLKKLASKPAHIRVGQFYFNELSACHPSLAEEIRGCSHSDPYYNDRNIDSFWNMVYNNWQI